ncbi:MAG: hypothetical protein FWG29_10810 [Treponema sp.]|nr:hypothetical protein [Treponema sp.]
MTIEEFQIKLSTLLKGLPVSDFDTITYKEIAELDKLYGETDDLGMELGKKLIFNLADALKTRKSGGNTDESVQVRLTAIDFYLKNLQSGSAKDL